MMDNELFDFIHTFGVLKYYEKYKEWKESLEDWTIEVQFNRTREVVQQLMNNLHKEYPIYHPDQPTSEDYWILGDTIKINTLLKAIEHKFNKIHKLMQRINNLKEKNDE
jgi:hypothetical protein